MLYGPNTALTKQKREDLLHHLAAGKHVRNAAGNAQIVLQHHEFSAGQANQVCAADTDVNISCHLYTAHLTPEMLAGIDHLARHNAVANDAPFVVDVLQKEIESRYPLRQAAFNRLPLRA